MTSQLITDFIGDYESNRTKELNNQSLLFPMNLNLLYRSILWPFYNIDFYNFCWKATKERLIDALREIKGMKVIMSNFLIIVILKIEKYTIIIFTLAISFP